ncbi:MAG: DUF5816 domain-containing protein [Halobacteriaceae archaeon]
MATDQTTRVSPFDLHCGLCEHASFHDWDRTPYCTHHDRKTVVRVGDVCSHFREGPGTGPTSDRERADLDVVVVENERLEGVTGAFYATYEEEQHHGWYCSNCDTTDVAVDTMGRLKCNRCGNVHHSREWDAAYL